MTSKVKVNTVETESGSTLTLGKSGDTVTLASGASQSGFGRTGTVDWDTTAKTASFTAVSGNGYFVDTSSSAITVTLPASPSAGDIVAVADYTRTWQTNNCTIARNSEKIGGIAANATLSTQGQAATFVYVDSTEGWINVQETSNSATGTVDFISATGGTETTSGNYKIHTFTSPGTFTVSSISNVDTARNEVSYLVVAGGGGGGGILGGGGGAGGFRESKGPTDCYTASPLEGSTNITVATQPYPITVGGGGAGYPAPLYPTMQPGTSGANSVFSTITSAGGGGGGGGPGPSNYGLDGGSGGGGPGYGTGSASAGDGNTPPVSPPQGNPGGNNPTSPGVPYGAAGGGGAGAAGSNIRGSGNEGSNGGNGVATLINPATGEPSSCTQYYAGGGGGSTYGVPSPGGGSGGLGGGGDAKNPGCGSPIVQCGTANTGGGGGGTGEAPATVNAGNGGSGIVIIRYKYQ